MKTLKDYINEGIITEGQAKNLADVKKGDILWGVHMNNFDSDELKYVKLEVEAIFKDKDDISIKLKQNSLDLNYYFLTMYGDSDFSDLKAKTVFAGKYETEVVIIGIDKDIVKEYVRQSDKETIEDIQNEIKGLQEKINKANEKLQKYELRLNAEITESLK